MMSQKKTTIRLSDQANANMETIRAHVGDLTQNAAIETALAFYAAFLSGAGSQLENKTPAGSKAGVRKDGLGQKISHAP